MSRPGNRPAPASNIPASARQNEYFVPRDGIDREVITSDICRYLGNDALVRPGTYESPDGRVTQGYFITAYRNLTSAMIQDLKADSARWEQERRAASRTSGGGAGGTMHSGQPNGMFMRGSNSPLGSREQPRGQSDYSTWKNSQLDNNAYGRPPPPIDRMEVDYVSPGPIGGPAYGNAPYPGGQPAGYPPTAYPQIHGGAPGGYPAPQGFGGYPANPPTQYSPGPQSGPDRYPPPLNPGYQETFVHGSNYQATGYPGPGPNRMTSSAPPTRTFGITAGGPGYGDPDSVPFGYPPAQNQIPTFPNDPLYGRGAYNTTATNPPPTSSDDLGSPAGTAPPRQGYSTGPDPSQFEEHQSPGLPNAPTPTNGTATQLPAGGPSAGRRDAEPRDREHRHQSRRPETEDRHAADRARHRHGR
ncbi:hypothetical protein B0T25DRAFT_63243 [Lasiosphaeria hispida]|uniref:Transcription factor RfeG n=1 Tax=Lasiosphaeria hispida TaxID=260671 RepID=A0AAJ0HXC4_9PEZI|nr:hypothetical protein B0T25DRAFT_63243 [Lasiosphaeria hispida]